MYSLNRKGPKLPPTMDPEGDVKAGEAGRPGLAVQGFGVMVPKSLWIRGSHL